MAIFSAVKEFAWGISRGTHFAITRKHGIVERSVVPTIGDIHGR